MNQVKSKKVNWRHLAETIWGKGGTTAYKTNRKGAYYYSCSSHGGYIVDATVLTPTERHLIDQFIKPENLDILKGPDGLCYGIDYNAHARYGAKSKSYRCPFGSQWEYVQFYLFEEDCAWSVLENFTDIRAVHNKISENKREELINLTFTRWFKNKQVAQG